jgi:hypothetical protein
MTLLQEFEVMMRESWPTVERETDQWYDLLNAFMGGALIAFTTLPMQKYERMAEVQRYGRQAVENYNRKHPGEKI